MIFVDTNVILDLLEADASDEAEWSRRTMIKLSEASPLVANLIVVAELSSQVERADELPILLSDAGITLVDLDIESAHRAGRAHHEYRRRGGPRRSILPDFLIAAHAAVIGATLFTRDRRLSSFFPELTFITPETHPYG